MQVYFLGADTSINYQPSSTWLAEQARFWPWRSHLLMNAPRSEALSVLSMEGMMVVFCSLVENMPYVVAEVPLLLDKPFVENPMPLHALTHRLEPERGRHHVSRSHPVTGHVTPDCSQFMSVPLETAEVNPACKGHKKICRDLQGLVSGS